MSKDVYLFEFKVEFIQCFVELIITYFQSFMHLFYFLLLTQTHLQFALQFQHLNMTGNCAVFKIPDIHLALDKRFV